MGIFSTASFRTGTPSSIIIANGAIKEEWEKVYSNILRKNRKVSDPSISHIDGSHTPVYHGGEQVEYQCRKKCRTTNTLFISDNHGIPLAMFEPQTGKHADLYEIEQRIGEFIEQLANTDIAVDGLFCNLDAGFDGKQLRSALIYNGIVPNVCPAPRNRGECTE